MIFELAAFNLTSVQVASDLNVQRVEYCADYSVGGISPSMDDFTLARKAFPNELLVMIRTRGGDFFYSQAEIEAMRKLIVQFASAGADGFVFGCLTKSMQVDVQAVEVLKKQCGNIPVTFHRAIDDVQVFEEGIEQLINMGIQRVLTSGAEKSAYAGKEKLKAIQHKYGDAIEIVAGGGIRSSNVKELIEFTGVQSVHSAALLNGSTYADKNEVEKIMGEIAS